MSAQIGQNRIRGDGGSKNTKKSRTSFMYVPLPKNLTSYVNAPLACTSGKVNYRLFHFMLMFTSKIYKHSNLWTYEIIGTQFTWSPIFLFLGDFPSIIFFERPNLRWLGGAIGFFVSLTWPVIVWILLKFVGYIIIGLTFGFCRQFVNSTFFRWTDRMGVTFSQLLDLARPPSVIVGKACKRIGLT